MTQSSTHKITGLTLGGLSAAAMLTTLGSAPAAQASCISAFGVSTSTDCSSTLTSVAIGIGVNAQAHADGLFGAAFTFGDNSGAVTKSVASLAFNIGPGANAYAGTLAPGGPEFLNVAVQLGGANSSATAQGGAVNLAINVGGDTSSARVITTGGQAYGNTAISAFNTNTGVLVDTGPLAVAVGLFQSNPSFSFTITKNTPGININGFRLPPGSAASIPRADSARQNPRPAATRNSTTARPATARPATARPATSTSSRNRDDVRAGT